MIANKMAASWRLFFFGSSGCRGGAPQENAATGRGGDVNTAGRTPWGARRKDFLPATRATAATPTSLFDCFAVLFLSTAKVRRKLSNCCLPTVWAGQFERLPPSRMATARSRRLETAVADANGRRERRCRQRDDLGLWPTA